MLLLAKRKHGISLQWENWCDILTLFKSHFGSVGFMGFTPKGHLGDCSTHQSLLVGLSRKYAKWKTSYTLGSITLFIDGMLLFGIDSLFQRLVSLLGWLSPGSLKPKIGSCRWESLLRTFALFVVCIPSLEHLLFDCCCNTPRFYDVIN